MQNEWAEKKIITLARTVPEQSKKYGVRTCLVGLDESDKLVRVYPISPYAKLKARHQFSAIIGRNPHDSRMESYKFKDAENSILSVSDVPSIDTKYIWSMPCDRSLSELNDQRKSIGLLRPINMPRLEWTTREQVIHNPSQLALFDEFFEDMEFHGFKTAKDYKAIPYVVFLDQLGYRHRLQLREWGVFEYLRKEDLSGLKLSEGYFRDTQEFIILVGNMTHRRNNWMVLHVWKRKRKEP